MTKYILKNATDIVIMSMHIENHPVVPPPVPPLTLGGGRRPQKKKEDILEVQSNLFELTLQTFKPTEPFSDPKHRPVRRIRVWEHHGSNNDTMFTPNVGNVVNQLNDCEHFGTSHLNSNRELHAELKASNERLQLVKRGVPLYRAYQAKPQICSPVHPHRRFTAINDIINKIPAKYTGIPPVRKIQFVNPVTSSPSERIDLVSRINDSEVRKASLKKIVQKSENQELQYHNEMVEHLNHVNERRMRCADKFFDDVSKYGIDKAQIISKRDAQKSRLRVMCKADWWNDFIEFAYSLKIMKNEERFIERLTRHPNMAPADFISLVHELSKRNGNEKCLHMLDWINDRCKIIDQITLKIILEDADIKYTPRQIAHDE